MRPCRSTLTQGGPSLAMRNRLEEVIIFVMHPLKTSEVFTCGLPIGSINIVIDLAIHSTVQSSFSWSCFVLAGKWFFYKIAQTMCLSSKHQQPTPPVGSLCTSVAPLNLLMLIKWQRILDLYSSLIWIHNSIFSLKEVALQVLMDSQVLSSRHLCTW